jgi:shikimate kinase
MKKLILIGYMGCGKTTISNELSKKLQIPVVDLDQIIEGHQEMSVEKIFETKGELYFRKLEHQYFSEWIANEKQFIMSTGGGTPCYYDNHLLLRDPNVISFYLKASIETLATRLTGNEKKQRPLVSHLHPEEAKEFIAKHLFERSFFYHQASHTIDVDGKSVAEITKEIGLLLA